VNVGYYLVPGNTVFLGLFLAEHAGRLAIDRLRGRR
jgi:hypothetical protein